MNPQFVLLAAKGHAPPPLIDIDLTVVIQFIIFLVLLILLTKLVFKPFLEIMRERSENIEGAREKATVLDSEADEKLSSYEEQVKSARKDAAEVRGKYRDEGEAKAKEILSGARAKTDAKISAAREKTEQSVKAAQSALKKQADEVAKSIASKLLGREV